jgi:hypothetical protein
VRAAYVSCVTIVVAATANITKAMNDVKIINLFSIFCHTTNMPIKVPILGVCARSSNTLYMYSSSIDHCSVLGICCTCNTGVIGISNGILWWLHTVGPSVVLRNET